MQKTLQGDKTAFRGLIESYRNAVYGLAISYVGDFDVAEDLAQEAFLKAYYRLHTLEDGNRFGAWLRSIAANLCRMELRRRARAAGEVSGIDPDRIASSMPSPVELAELREDREGVLDALGRLPKSEREALTLYYLEERQVSAVGRFLGISTAAAKVRLHRARQKLRREMTDMADKTLSRRRLGPEFAKRVELKRFTDLARLSDDELKAVARIHGASRRHGMSLVYALASEDDETQAIRRRFLAMLSKEEQEAFEVNTVFYRDVMEPQATFRNEVLETAHSLQRAGTIRPAPDRDLPRGTIRITSFRDIGRLTDREIQRVLRETHTVDLAIALRGRSSWLRQVECRLLKNVSSRVVELIRLKQGEATPTRKQISGVRSEIVATAHRLQAKGVIRSGEEPQTAWKVDVKSFTDCTRLRDEETQAWLRETDSATVARALKSSGEAIDGVRKCVFSNVSKRVGGILRGKMRQAASEAEVRGARSRIVEAVKDLQAIGVIRPPARKPSAKRYARVVSEMAEREMDRARHSEAWTPESLHYLLPHIAGVMQSEGIDGVNDRLSGLQHPVLVEGLKLLAQKADRDEIIQRLTAVADEALRRAERAYETAIAGVAAISEGKAPVEVAERLRRRVA